MFRKLLNLLLPKSKLELYSSHERLLYSYWNGKKWVRIDPIEQYKRLMDVWPTIDSDMLAAFSPLGSKFALRSHENMVKTMRSCFKDLDHFDQGGLTESAVIQLVGHFFKYCDTVEKQFQDICDGTDGNIAAYVMSYFPIWRRLFRPKPTYLENLGFWLNRRRLFYRKSFVVAFGVGVGLGLVDPGMSYYRAITDGEGEAKLLKAKTDSLKRNASDE